MRMPLAALLLTGSVWFSACLPRLSSQSTSSNSSTGFWFWGGSAAETERLLAPVDILFVHVGYIRGPKVRARGEPKWTAYARLPDNLPAAREYSLVWRYEDQGVPDLAAAPAVAREFARLAHSAQSRHLNLSGLQLDIDSPTGALENYARFLAVVRKELPQGSQISITALLDWFRAGTAMDQVVRQVDEFVPQFYDVQGSDEYGDRAVIAAPVNAERWGPRFRQLGKRFRIGISTFGRAESVPPAGPSNTRYFFRDLAPIDVATNGAFELEASHNHSGELLLRYRAARETRIGYDSFEPGEAIQFVVASPESVRAAVESARQMGDGMAGIVFFRWPSSDESLTMQPDEALMAAGLAAPGMNERSRVDVIDGRCSEVECVDVYLLSATPLSPKPLRYIVRSSTPLEYFVPENNIPARMTGPSRLEVNLPAYCGRARLYLGRAVSLKRTEFSVEEQE